MTVLRRVQEVVPVPVPPGWTPGICHHDLHVVIDGKRLGLLLLDDDLASLLPCLHNTKDEPR
jgi:hypothetical protein